MRKERRVFGYYTSPKTRKAVKLLAVTDNISMTEVVDRAVAEYLQRRGLTLPEEAHRE